MQIGIDGIDCVSDCLYRSMQTNFCNLSAFSLPLSTEPFFTGSLATKHFAPGVYTIPKTF